MRIVSVVAGCIGLLIAAYVADRLLQEIQINVGIYAGSQGWHELGLVASIVPRLVIVAGLAAVWAALRAGKRAESWTVLGIGALTGLLPSLLFGLHIAMQPSGLPFISLSTETNPIWGGTAVFLPWTAIGLAVIGFARLRMPGRTFDLGPDALAAAAALALLVTYPLDAAFESSAMELAWGLDAYPLFVLLGLAIRLAMMAAVVFPLAAALGTRLGNSAILALVGIGILGLLVLPVVGMQANPGLIPALESPAATLNPGTAGRWLASGFLVAGVVAWWRTSRASAPAEPVTATPEAKTA